MTQIMGRRFCRLMIAVMALTCSPWVFAKNPDCTHPDAWPSGMAFTQLKNAGLVDNNDLDFTKTKVMRLASEKVSKDVYRQVHLVQFIKKTGEKVDAITSNEVSHQECSMSAVDVYVVSKRLGNHTEKK